MISLAAQMCQQTAQADPLPPSSVVRWRCPTCSQPLLPKQTSSGRTTRSKGGDSSSATATGGGGGGGGGYVQMLQCRNAHTIAAAKQGHVNLLPAGRLQPKTASSAGDDEAMVRARRAFLDSGHYCPVADAVAAAVAAGLQECGAHAASPAADEVSAALAGTGTGPADSRSCSPPRTARTLHVLDAGCGEGHYLGHLLQRLHGDGVIAHGYGVDVSKLAVRLAAARHKGAAFAVASSYRLPFDDQVFDAVLSVFAPCPAGEICRVLRPGVGALIVASPGPRHLAEFREMLYDSPQPLPPRAATDPDMQGLPPPVSETTVQYTLQLPGTEAAQLLAMTPYAHHRASTQWQRAMQESGSSVSVTVDIVVARYVLG